jgi:hypothetical protein
VCAAKYLPNFTIFIDLLHNLLIRLMKSNEFKEGKHFLTEDETWPNFQLLEEIQKMYKNKKKGNEKSSGSSGIISIIKEMVKVTV